MLTSSSIKVTVVGVGNMVTSQQTRNACSIKMISVKLTKKEEKITTEKRKKSLERL